MPAHIEKRKMTKPMFQALKKHIMREREKRKQEREADAAIERQKREAELHRKKEQEHNLTLEQTKEEIAKLEAMLEEFKKQKHELFAQLKKVLEDESKRKMKEQQNDLAIGYYPGLAGPHPVFLQGSGHMGRAMVFKPQSAPNPSPMLMHSVPAVTAASSAGMGIKRERSPSPTLPQPPQTQAQAALYQYGQGDAASAIKYITGFGHAQAASFVGSDWPVGGGSSSSMHPAAAGTSSPAASRIRNDKASIPILSEDKMKPASVVSGAAAIRNPQPHSLSKGSIVTGYPIHMAGQPQQPLQQQQQQPPPSAMTAAAAASVNGSMFGAGLRAHQYPHHDTPGRFY